MKVNWYWGCQALKKKDKKPKIVHISSPATLKNSLTILASVVVLLSNVMFWRLTAPVPIHFH